MSLFSGLNNLRDITVTSEFSAICGYTDEDIDTLFAPELNGLIGTTVITGQVNLFFITRSMFYCYFKIGFLKRIGLKQVHRLS